MTDVSSDRGELIVRELECMSVHEDVLNRAIVVWLGTLIASSRRWPPDHPLRRRVAIAAGRAAVEHEQFTGLTLLACRELDTVLFASTVPGVELEIAELEELNALRKEIGFAVAHR